MLYVSFVFITDCVCVRGCWSMCVCSVCGVLCDVVGDSCCAIVLGSCVCSCVIMCVCA